LQDQICGDVDHYGSDHVRHALVPYVSKGAIPSSEQQRTAAKRTVGGAGGRRRREGEGEWNPRLYAWRRTPHLPCRPTAAAPPAVHSMHRHGARCAGGWLASPHLQSMHGDALLHLQGLLITTNLRACLLAVSRVSCHQLSVCTTLRAHDYTNPRPVGPNKSILSMRDPSIFYIYAVQWIQSNPSP
jgi:hypothetical protein